jgi:hypothetical protein
MVQPSSESRGIPLSAADLLPPPFRPLPIRLLNAAGRAAGGLDRYAFRLDEASLLEAAMRAAGTRDVGPDTFLPGFRTLLRSLEEDARLSTFGRFFARRQLLELLTHRLRIYEYRRRHPEVSQERIRRPIFILGLPRTGTTLLLGLLAEDRAHRAALSWEVDEPCPPPRTPYYETDPRIEATRARFEQLQQLAPGFQAIHPIGERMPQECIVLTAPEFMSIRFEMCFDVASYQRWLPEQDMTGAYDFHKAFLQHLQSGHAGERWVLKSPGHLGAIDALFEAYPDAIVIQTHRDPVRVVPSVASLEYTMRQVSSDAVDPERLGRQQLWMWSRVLEQGLESRREHPEREAQILDLSMGEIVRDPLGTAERIYRRFDLAWNEDTRSRMQAYLARHPKDEFGPHRYSLDAFGLAEEEVDQHFKQYRDYFDIEREPPPR